MGKTVILDNGHGGMINGEYQTSGKRSPNWHHGVLYEGAFNRWIVSDIMEYLDMWGVPYYHVSPELEDISLDTRIDRVNNIHSKNKSVYLLSIHANAGGGEGVEGFTSPGETDSDVIAEKFLSGIREDFSDHKIRSDFSDGDMDKEAKFKVLVKTNCPAYLHECGFMDFKRDYDKMNDRDYRKKLALSLSRIIKNIYYG